MTEHYIVHLEIHCSGETATWQTTQSGSYIKLAYFFQTYISDMVGRALWNTS